MDINHSPKVQPAGSFLKLTMIQRPQSLHRTPRRKPAVTRRQSVQPKPMQWSTSGADLGKESKLESSLVKSSLVEQGVPVEAQITH